MQHHGIHYKRAAVHWTEALPVGNGTFGAMAYLEQQHLCLSMNHYDIYYSGHPDYSRTAQRRTAHFNAPGGSTKQEYIQRAEKALQNGMAEAYQKTLYPAKEGQRMSVAQGIALPAVGNLKIRFAPQTQQWEPELQLSVEQAEVSYRVGHGTQAARAAVKMLQGVDTLLCQMEQTQQGLVQQLVLEIPRGRRMRSMHPHLLHQEDGIFSVAQSFGWEEYPEDEPFRFCVCLQLLHAVGRAEQQDGRIVIHLEQAEERFAVLVSVATELEGKACEMDAEEKNRWAAQHLQELLQTHRTYWEHFFGASAITLPDTFLENLWYLHLYVLACSSGRGGRRSEQASGLNGLWDIRRPTLWGSVWYWDVNIQATYWGTYAANHLELSQVFCDGFLQHEAAGRRFAEEFHGMPGYAGDYPHPFYNCMGPWCAQFLWWQYVYSGDEAFLRDKAYPHFVQQVRFWQRRLSWDEQRGAWEVFPDVSPEQGPLGHNAVITIACVKYLLQFTRQSAELLQTEDGIAELCTTLLRDLPAYETAPFAPYGEILKDCREAPAGLHLRHPSLLMPIFPAREWDQYSGEKERQIAEATVRYAIDHTELGVFGFGWLAAAAAHMGLGDLALRTLYEKGFDLHLRANGMGAEETNRWLNLCLVNKPPMGYPFMMECVGETIAAVTELLLQSRQDGEICIFPALPTDWRDCSFHSLRAAGGVLVSAQRRAGKTQAVLLQCPVTQTLRLRGVQGLQPPLGTAVCEQEGVTLLDAQAGQQYLFGVWEKELPKRPAPHYYIGHTGARIYAGKDQNTEYERMLDTFVCDYYVADTRHRNRIVYFFAAGWEENCLSEEEQRFGLPVTVLWENASYEVCKGYGFCNAQNVGVAVVGSGRLAQRYWTSDEPAVFVLDLPRGQYELFVGCSDRCDMRLRCCGAVQEVHNPAGRCSGHIFPIVHQQDGLVQIELEPVEGKAWKVHTIICKKHHVFS